MNKREHKKWHKPLAQRRDGKAILLKWVNQFMYWYKEQPGKPEDISQWHLNDMDCRVEKPRCLRCWDTGHVGTGPAPPLTGIACSYCKTNEDAAQEGLRVRGLENRIRQLEALLADREIAK